jgi:hypothetical protein
MHEVHMTLLETAHKLNGTGMKTTHLSEIYGQIL